MFSALIDAVQKKKPFLKEGSFPKRIQMARRLLLTLGTRMVSLLLLLRIQLDAELLFCDMTCL